MDERDTRVRVDAAYLAALNARLAASEESVETRHADETMLIVRRGVVVVDEDECADPEVGELLDDVASAPSEPDDGNR